MMPPESVMIHFWKRVDKSGDCWVWKGLAYKRHSNSDTVSGTFHWRGNGVITAHYLTYRLTFGDVPYGHLLRHTCGNDLCVKPEHLSIVSRIQKAHDARRGWSGRHFNERDVTEILDRLEHGEPTSSVAKAYDVRGSLVARIKNFTGWRHVGDPGRRQRIADLPDNRVVSDLTFWQHVDKSSECWVWTRKINDSGYGTFGKHLAHRYSMKLHLGEMPAPSLVVRHLCHNRQCVRPSHLALGDHYDNFQDNVRDNRSVVAKLTESQAREIRELFASGQTIRKLAKTYSVSVSTVSNIVRGRRWLPRSVKSTPMPRRWYLVRA